MRLAAACLIALCLGAAAGRAAEPAVAVLDVGAVPYLKPQGRAAYEDFLLMNLPRAMAVASNGAYGGFGGGQTIEDMRSKALKSCVDKGGTDCAIYAEDLQVVWQGHPAQALPPVPGPLIAARDYAFAPDARFIWYGPQTARGLLVWGHGTGTGSDSRGRQPPADGARVQQCRVRHRPLRPCAVHRLCGRCGGVAAQRPGEPACARLAHGRGRRPVARRVEQPAGAGHTGPGGCRGCDLACQVQQPDHAGGRPVPHPARRSLVHRRASRSPSSRATSTCAGCQAASICCARNCRRASPPRW